MEKKRYDSIDTFKIIGAFLVVCLHTLMEEPLNGYVKTIARIGVPYFFLVSGFFAYRAPEDWTKELRLKKMKNVFKHVWIMFGVDLVYAFSGIFLYEHTLRETVMSLFHFSFVTANFHVAGHLWFMRALICLEIGELAFYDILHSKKLKYILLVVWALDLFLFKYSFLFGFTLQGAGVECLSKYIGTGFLYYFIGWLIRQEETKISEWIEGKEKWILLMTVFCCGMNLLEYHILESYQKNLMPINYFFTFFLINGIFVLLIRYREWGKGSFVHFLGGKASMYIYYWHVLIRNILSVYAKEHGIPKINLLNPIVIFLASIGLSLAILGLKNLIFRKKIRG